MRKSETPHNLHIEIYGKTSINSHCSCKVGLTGRCPHILGLIKTLQGFKLHNFKCVPGQQICTSIPQQWHVPWGDKVCPIPINHVVVAKTCGSRKRNPVLCQLNSKVLDKSLLRGKLQKRRSKLNDEINRELRMRNGAENLFRATDNKRLKELVSVELLFFNNIQLLKEEVSDLNSSVNIYQHDNSTVVPMIPLGLKETKDVDFKVAIKDFILEHYSEDGDGYTTEIQDLQELRLVQNLKIISPRRWTHPLSLESTIYRMSPPGGGDGFVNSI